MYFCEFFTKVISLAIFFGKKILGTNVLKCHIAEIKDLSVQT